MLPRKLLRLSACALLAACVSCDGARERGRVLLIGIDGATLRVARPLLKQGRLPHLAAIASAGVYGPLRSHYPLTSPRIWNSIATGKTPDQHGIRDFAREGEDGKRRLYLSSDRKVHALWNIASDAGMTVGVVNWWTTYPLERVRGVMVSDHLLAQEIEGRRSISGAQPVELGPVAHPPEWNERVRELMASDEPVVDFPDPFADAGRFANWMEPGRLSRRFRNDAGIVRVALAVEREVHPDLLMVFLPGIDRVSHRLWGALDDPSRYEVLPPMTPEERAAGLEALLRYYEYTDALIGRLAEDFGPGDLVMVVSDHGFEAGNHMFTLTGVHKSPRALHGVLFARGPGVRPPETQEPVSVNDVTPTILAWLGLPRADDMQGRPAAFLESTPDTHVSTYDGTPIDRLAEIPSGAEPAILEQLESLGYLEPGDS